MGNDEMALVDGQIGGGHAFFVVRVKIGAVLDAFLDPGHVVERDGLEKLQRRSFKVCVLGRLDGAGVGEQERRRQKDGAQPPPVSWPILRAH